MQVKPLRLSELSVEQKIGQMILARNPIDEESFEFTLELVKNRALGGIHPIHKRSGPGYYIKDELELVRAVKEAADYPILICEDMENGYQRGTDLPYQLAVGSTDDEELAYLYGHIAASEAKRDGYNLVFGPIVDIAENPQSSCVGVRSFGGDREIVARMSAAVIKGYQDCGLIVTAKHFPGFGPSAVDSHIGMVELEGDEKNLLENGIYPYTYCMENADLSGIMMGHIMCSKIDPEYPASVSPTIIGLLRKIGFEGLIMTDSFAMVGMRTRYSLRECFQLAMQAGNDMVMGSYRDSVKQQYEIMLDAYHKGLVSEAIIDMAVSRVIRAQNRTLITEVPTSSKAHEEIADEIGRKSICVQLSGAAFPAVDTKARHLFVVQEGNLFMNPRTGTLEQDKQDMTVFENTVRERFVSAELLYVPEFPAKPQIDQIMERSLEHDSIVFVLSNKSVSYTGSSDATKRMLAVMDGLRPKISAVVLFGNPYAAREFGTIPRLIFGHDGNCCQHYAALTLAGEHEATGKLPVSW